MKIESLRLKNYKGFTEATIDLNPSLTVISGMNGAGKSSILSAVATATSWIIARLKSDKGRGSFIATGDVNNSAKNGYISATFDFAPEQPVLIPNIAKSGVIKEFSLDFDAIKSYAEQKRSLFQAQEAIGPLPLFALYGVKRAVFDIPLKIRNKEYEPFDAYDKSLDGAANFRSFFTWFRNSEDTENRIRARHMAVLSEFGSLDSPIVAGLDAFRRAIATFMPEYSNIRIENHPLRMCVDKGGKTLNVNQLSDGEKIYLALVGDLCHRLAIANPGSVDPLEGEGIVMIDELDLHLHPQWQSEIATRLTDTFPNIQFIVTTHSPHVINSVPTETLRMLSDGEFNTPDYGYGLPSEIVLRDIMNLSNDVPREVDNEIKKFYAAVGDDDKQAAAQSMTMLESIVPAHPELTRMRKIQERMNRR